MAISELQGKTVPVKLWTKLEDVESEALTQLKNIASLSWVFHHVAVMPDVHFGIGATVVVYTRLLKDCVLYRIIKLVFCGELAFVLEYCG